MQGMHGAAAGAGSAHLGAEAGAAADENPVTRERDADKWIAQRLRDINYDLTHPEVQLLADHLQSLGEGTLVNMKKSNELLSSCENLVRCTLPPPPESWDRESQCLITITVRAAIPRFIVRSMPKWDSEQSAITTYFVNYCLFEFKKVYLQYHKEESQCLVERPVGGDVVSILEKRVTEDNPEDLAIARQTIREVLTLLDSQEFADIVLLAARGLTRQQIAEALGISPSTLSRRISEYRRKLERAGWSISSKRG